MVFAFALADRQIIDAGDAQAHQPILVEFPILVAIAAEPVTAVVVPFIREACGDAVVAKRPEFLDQPVVELAAPLARQKLLDRVTAVQEFGPAVKALPRRIRT